ncbi:MAG: KH domain-containing protein [Bacilli bacterium]|nr:KH domain-containing protein [Bacilli bacterium]
MELVELTEYIVKSLLVDPESVSVKQFETDDDSILIQVLVDEKYAGTIIGRGGKIANSIRNIVQASSYLKDNKRVRINIDTF